MESAVIIIALLSILLLSFWFYHQKTIKILQGDYEKRIKESLKSLSQEIFQANSRSFLELATTKLEVFQEKAEGSFALKEKSIEELVKPMKATLENYEKKMEEFSKSWSTSQASLDTHLKGLLTSQLGLKQETGNLVKALRQPHVRGRWGEIQLKRVVEMAGMLEHCDFQTQETSSLSEKRLRPDLIVKLPNERQIVVDSKAPLHAYLEALENHDDAQKLDQLRLHAKQIRNHISQLSLKSYWDQFSSTPEFVVLFLPGETFFSSALEQDPTLIEFGVEHKVLISTPTTLIALLRSVAYGWSQEKLAKNAEEISGLGKDLYKRLGVFIGHMEGVRKGLENSVEFYNKAVNSLESRVLVSARKFKDLGASTDDELSNLKQIDKTPRESLSLSVD